MAGNAAEVVVGAFPDKVDEQKKGGGRHFYLKEAARFHVEGSITSAVVPMQVRLLSAISDTGRRKAEDAEARVFVVVIDQDGNERRELQPLAEFEYPVLVGQKPGLYTVLGLIVSGEASRFAKNRLMKRDLDTGEYLVPVIDHKGKELAFLEVEEKDNAGTVTGSLYRSTRIKGVEVELTEKHFIAEGTGWYDEWARVWPLWQPTNWLLLWGHRITAPFRLAAAAAWQLVTGAALVAMGLFWSVFMAARGFDWGAIRSLDNARKRHAASQCEPESRPRYTADGELEKMADTYAIWSTPYRWLPWAALSWFILPWVGLTSNWFSFLVVTALFVIAHGALRVTTPNNDGESRELWQHLFTGFIAFVRDLPVSRIFDIIVFWKKPVNPDDSMIDIMSMKNERDIKRALPVGTRVKLWINQQLRFAFQPVLRAKEEEEEG